MISKGTSLEELAAIVSRALAEDGLTAVLTGGSVVTFYTNNEYQSRDLDFVSPDSHRRIAKTMARLGFTPKGRLFEHPATRFTVEFPPGPLAIGSHEPIEPEGERVIEGTKVKLLSPTQSVMDRLSWFFFHNDRQCLDQAVMVCLSQPVNLARVKAFAEGEGEAEKYKVFLSALESRRKR